MLPIVAGIITALLFAAATLTSARASRVAGAASAAGGVLILELLIVTPIAVIGSPLPAGPAVPVEAFAFASIGGVANVVGLLLIYAAFRIGAVGIISTVVSTEGAIAATISVLAGQALVPGSGPALAVVATGVVLAATSGGHEIEEGVAISRGQSLRAAGLAALAALMFGLTLFTTGHASAVLPPAWTLLPGRLFGVVAVSLPLLVTGRLHIPRAALPFVVLTGFGEIAGYSVFAIGARVDIALTAVLASMFAPIAAIAAFVLFRERLAPRQIMGIALVVAGIAILGALTA